LPLLGFHRLFEPSLLNLAACFLQTYVTAMFTSWIQQDLHRKQCQQHHHIIHESAQQLTQTIDLKLLAQYDYKPSTIYGKMLNPGNPALSKK